MPSWKTLTKIVFKKVFDEVKESIGGRQEPSAHRVECNLCHRLFPKGTLIHGVCPLCWKSHTGPNQSRPKTPSIPCSGCGRLLHPDALKEGTCIECWMTRWKNENSKDHGPLTLSEAYKILECSESCSAEEIKRKYRTLAKFFHPDMIQGKDLHPEFVEFAKKRFQAIGQAYDLVMESRGKTA
jgi:hypothetical protein